MLTQSHWIVLSTKNYTIWINDFKINIQKLIVIRDQNGPVFQRAFCLYFYFFDLIRTGWGWGQKRYYTAITFSEKVEFILLTKSLLAFPWLPMETTGLNPQKRVYSGAREKQKILRNCLQWWPQRTDFLHWLRCKPDREQSVALARFCFRPVDIRLPSCPPVRHIIFSFFTCTHHESEEGYFGKMGLRSEKAVAKHILQENVGKAFGFLISQASTIWLGTRGEQSSNPWRSCRCLSMISTSTGCSWKPKLCRCAAEFRAPPVRRARPKGSCCRFLSLLEKSGARRVGTKTSDRPHRRKNAPQQPHRGDGGEIEKETGYQALRRWEQFHPKEEAVGYFVWKWKGS